MLVGWLLIRHSQHPPYPTCNRKAEYPTRNSWLNSRRSPNLEESTGENTDNIFQPFHRCTSVILGPNSAHPQLPSPKHLDGLCPHPRRQMIVLCLPCRSRPAFRAGDIGKDRLAKVQPSTLSDSQNNAGHGQYGGRKNE